MMRLPQESRAPHRIARPADSMETPRPDGFSREGIFSEWKRRYFQSCAAGWKSARVFLLASPFVAPQVISSLLAIWVRL